MGLFSKQNKDNEEVVAPEATEKKVSTNPFREDGESQQEYNERIPVAVQPVLPGPTHNYLGEEL